MYHNVYLQVNVVDKIPSLPDIQCDPGECVVICLVM